MNNLEKIQKQQIMAVCAIDVMAQKIMQFKEKRLNNDQIMNLCVMRILNEFGNKLEKIEKGEEIPLDDFENLFNKN